MDYDPATLETAPPSSIYCDSNDDFYQRRWVAALNLRHAAKYLRPRQVEKVWEKMMMKCLFDRIENQAIA